MDTFHLYWRDIMSAYIETIEIIITGFRPMRSATIPQKIDANPLPTIYDAPTVEIYQACVYWKINIFCGTNSVENFVARLITVYQELIYAEY